MYKHVITILLLLVFAQRLYADSVVVFNEIHYHPAENENLEFVELRNLESTSVDLTDWNLPAVGYTFPAGTLVPTDACIVVARSPATLRQIYPDLAEERLHGPFEGKLAKMFGTSDTSRRRGDMTRH